MVFFFNVEFRVFRKEIPDHPLEIITLFITEILIEFVILNPALLFFTKEFEIMMFDTLLK
jgi:hypothetical protein